MKFKKLVITNFRQFKGTSEINFSTNDDGNITVIYGGITHGKTTLLQSFNWVLYNKVALQNPTQLLNLEVEAAMEPGDTQEVCVELYIIKDDEESDGNLYRFKRVQKYIANPECRVVASTAYAIVERKDNDTWMRLGNFEECVNNILPQSLSSYFFFDGERMDTISKEQRQGSQEVGNSVKSILGLEHWNSAIKHLKGGSGSRTCVISELRNKLNSSASQELEDKKNTIKHCEEVIFNSEKKIEEYHLEIDKLETSKSAKEQVILDNKDTYKKQQEKLDLKDRLSKLEKSSERLYQNYISYFNNYYLDFFYYGLNDKLEKLYDSGVLKESNESVPNMHQKSIEFLLNRGICLCGEKIVEGDEHYNKLIEEMKKLPPQSIGTTISTFKKEAKVNVSEIKSNNFKTELINNKFNDITENQHEIDVLNDAVDRLSANIQLDVDVGGLEIQVKEIDEKIKSFYEKIGIEKNTIETQKAAKQRAEEEINKLAQYDEKNREILAQIDLADNIAKHLESIYKIRERELINNLQKEINYYLEKIYTGKRRMVITSDYKFKLVYDDDDIIDSVESEGLGTVKAISFMCGLLKVAKTKILEEIDNETMYPLVFDAPLSKIDSIHRKNVMSCLPDVASQVIIFTREKKDLDDISDDTRSKITTKYHIDKVTEKNSMLKKEED